MSPISTNANLCRLLTRPSGEYSRNRRNKLRHGLIARGREFVVVKCRSSRWSRKAWFEDA